MKKKKVYMRDGRTETCWCPNCFHKLDAFTSLSDNKDDRPKPEPGDYTICIECACVLKWVDEKTLVRSSLLEIPVESRMRFAQVAQAIQQLPPRSKEQKVWMQ